MKRSCSQCWTHTWDCDNCLIVYIYNIVIMAKKSINNVKNKSDKMIRFTFPEYWFVVEAKDTKEALKKAEKIISKK